MKHAVCDRRVHELRVVLATRLNLASTSHRKNLLSYPSSSLRVHWVIYSTNQCGYRDKSDMLYPDTMRIHKTLNPNPNTNTYT